jgi:hypothetical protein
LCRQKIRRLFSRMKAQIDRALADAAKSPSLLVQLVAVLAVTRELRMLEKHDRWKHAHAHLVDPEDEDELLRHVMRAFFGRGIDLYARLLATLGVETFDELIRLKGLLLWLAWDCGVILDDTFRIGDERDEIQERLWDKAALLELVQMMSGDNLSFEEAKVSILLVARPEEHQSAAGWIGAWEQWANAVGNARLRMRAGNLAQPSPNRLGALAYAISTHNPKLRIVSSLSTDTVGLFDFGPDSNEISYQSARVSSAEV